MIKLQDLTPAVYYTQSRDFQFIGRLYDVVLNYVKTNAANLYNLPVGKNLDEQLLNLLALTLGFKAAKNYNSKQLLAICSVLPTILKHKGSLRAVILATDALLAAEGVKQPLNYSVNPPGEITLYVAQELDDLTLFIDLLDYLLPAGMSCKIIKESQEIRPAQTTIGVTDSIEVTYQSELYLSKLLQKDRKGLILGQIGVSPSILSNTDIVQPSTEVTTGQWEKSYEFNEFMPSGYPQDRPTKP